MKGTPGTQTEEKRTHNEGPFRDGCLTTSLIELIDSVREVVEGTYPDEEDLVTLVVYRLLGGRGRPSQGDSVRVLRRGDPLLLN